MKINNAWVLDSWVNSDDEKIIDDHEGIELDSNALYEIIFEYFNAKVT